MSHPLAIVPTSTEDFLMPAEAARRCGRSVSWTYDRITDGSLRAVKRDGRAVICADSVDALLRSRPAPHGRPKLRLIIGGLK
ncbi:hypothetical protein Sa4125_39150 [Aureimonas sp. SA4125]|nr:hypothetical protein Sa4125_39150 [Aureimonas sp. SA4125]